MRIMKSIYHESRSRKGLLSGTAGVHVAAALGLMILGAGCGQRLIYPVKGQIVDKAGNPVPGMKGSTVEFDCLDAKSSANGVVDENGAFQLSTKVVGDGAHVGKHRVAILRLDRGPDVQVPHVIDPKYEAFETSGLTASVEPRDNSIKLEVDVYRP